MNNVVVRTISGAAYVATIVSSIVCGSPVVFACVFAACLTFCMTEYFKLSRMVGSIEPLGFLATGATLSFFLLQLFCCNRVAAFAAFLLLWSLMLAAEVFRASKLPMHNIAFELGGVMYAGMPFCAMAGMYLIDPVFLLGFFVFIWVSDTGAFCVGKLFGKHKLSERISPKKTIEGLAGGLLSCILAGALFAHFAQDANAGLVAWILLAVVTFAFGTIGDLVESLFKRYLGIKDSGAFLPGHGGALDRFDSALLAAPVAFAFLCMLEVL